MADLHAGRARRELLLPYTIGTSCGPCRMHSGLGGLKQARVRGRIGGSEFTSSVMPSGGGRLALSVSKAMMKMAGVEVGQTADVEITGTGRDEVGP